MTTATEATKTADAILDQMSDLQAQSAALADEQQAIFADMVATGYDEKKHARHAEIDTQVKIINAQVDKLAIEHDAALRDEALAAYDQGYSDLYDAYKELSDIVAKQADLQRQIEALNVQRAQVLPQINIRQGRAHKAGDAYRKHGGSSATLNEVRNKYKLHPYL